MIQLDICINSLLDLVFLIQLYRIMGHNSQQNGSDFCKGFSIVYITTAPKHPRSYRQPERFVDTLKSRTETNPLISYNF